MLIKKEDIINKCEEYLIRNPRTHAPFESTFGDKLRIERRLKTFSVDGNVSVCGRFYLRIAWTQNSACKPCVCCKLPIPKTSAQGSKRPPGSCLCSLLLLLCWFDGAELLILVLLIGLATILVRHVRVVSLWGCTRNILHYLGSFLHNMADIYAPRPPND